MKKGFTGILTALIAMLTLSATAQERIIEFNQLPKNAQSFVRAYYAEGNVSHVVEESELMSSKEYTLLLVDGTKIEFDRKGNWKEVDSKLNPVPAKIVPASIHAYIRKSFPNNNIVQISKSSRKYEAELTNGVDLEFNNKGQFVRIDD